MEDIQRQFVNILSDSLKLQENNIYTNIKWKEVLELIEKYNTQYENLKVIYDYSFHDRYFVLDNEKVYHCGASINRIGYRTFCINSIEDKLTKEALINYIKKITNKG